MCNSLRSGHGKKFKIAVFWASSSSSSSSSWSNAWEPRKIEHYRLEKKGSIAETKMDEESADMLLPHLSQYRPHRLAVSSRHLTHHNPRLSSRVYSYHVLQQHHICTVQHFHCICSVWIVRGDWELHQIISRGRGCSNPQFFGLTTGPSSFLTIKKGLVQIPYKCTFVTFEKIAFKVLKKINLDNFVSSRATTKVTKNEL